MFLFGQLPTHSVFITFICHQAFTFRLELLSPSINRVFNHIGAGKVVAHSVHVGLVVGGDGSVAVLLSVGVGILGHVGEEVGFLGVHSGH